MTQDAIDDLERIERHPRVPVKRAAYSDRAAWLMAVLSELAYTPFDQDDDSSILSLARRAGGTDEPGSDCGAAEGTGGATGFGFEVGRRRRGTMRRCGRPSRRADSH